MLSLVGRSRIRPGVISVPEGSSTVCAAKTTTSDYDADQKIVGLDIGELISRTSGREPSNTTDQWSIRHTSTFRVAGRHVLNLWRIMRTELELSLYTLENTVYHLLRRRYAILASRVRLLTLIRVPKYAHSTLTEWHNSPVPAHRARMLHHLLGHTVLVLEMIDATDTIAKTA